MTDIADYDFEVPAALDVPTEQERTHGMLAHLLVFSGYAVPFGQLLGPALILILQKKPGSSFVINHAKEAINFQLTWFLPLVIFAVSVFLSFFLIGIPLLLLAIPVVAVGAILTFVMPIIAAMRANRGETYCYPASIRFIR